MNRHNALQLQLFLGNALTIVVTQLGQFRMILETILFQQAPNPPEFAQPTNGSHP